MTLRHPDAIGAVAITLVAIAVIVGALTGADPGFGIVRPATFPVVIGTLMLASAAWLGFDTLRGRASATLEEIDVRPLVASVPATNDPTALVASAAPARPRFAIW